MVPTGELLTLGLQHYQRGQLEDAVARFEEALRLNPDDAEAHYCLGLALKRQGSLTQAVAHFQQAIACRPDFPEAFSELGASFQHAVQYPPDSADAYNALGVAHLSQGKLEEALESFQQALRINPDFAEAHSNVGAVLQVQNKLAGAVASFQRAVHCQPNSARAHTDLGAALYRQGQARQALACFQEAVRWNPDYADAHHNRAILWLLLGDFEQGWPEYEWRWQTQDFYEWRRQTEEYSPQPPWDGGPLGGRTILLKAEQGLGDALQFIRYAPLVQQRGGRVIVGGCAPLRSLLRTCPGVDHVLARGEPLPHFDVYAYLLSLPRLLGTTLANVPADVPYLAADPELVTHWRKELSAMPGFKVGIAWQGDPTNKQDRFRSMPLAEFAPLAALEGVRLISLQKGPGTDQLGAVAFRFAVTDLGSQLDETSGAFMDTAAVLMNLDLVVTADTALAHLAGALGVPVWVALTLSPDWRWLLEREDSPWYPSMRLFRQQQPDRWPPVFERIAGEIRKLHV